MNVKQAALGATAAKASLLLALFSASAVACADSAACAKAPAGLDMAQRSVRVLYLGDSLSDFDRGSNHVDRLQAKLDALSPRCVSIYNYSHRGDYIERMMDRMHGATNCLSLAVYNGIWGRQYDWAFVFLGQNDTRSWSNIGFSRPDMSEEQLRKGFGELVALLKSKGIGRIILVSASSTNFELTSRKAADKLERIKSGKLKKSRTFRYGDPKFLEAFNAVLMDIARREQGVEYMDIYTPMKARKDKAELLRPTDGVHLTPKGHAFVADLEYEYLIRSGATGSSRPAR